jgi:threonine/homoserine/homoserine lactone efflux protein
MITDPAFAAHLWLYALLVLGIIALPGMDMAFVMASALADGRPSGLAATAGFVCGGAVHVAMGALGVGLLLQHSPLAFDALLLAGGLYVAWMGVGLLRHAGALVALGDAPSRPLVRTFARAVATCLLNPKAYVFTIAVLPQFIVPGAGPVAAQAAVLWSLGAAAQVLVYGLVALTAARLRAWMRGSAAAQVRLGRSVGLLLVAAAAMTLHAGLRAVG